MVMKKDGRVCQECLELIFDTDNLNRVLTTNSRLEHYIILCDSCVKKLKIKNAIPLNKYKPLKNFIEGNPTKTGTKRFYFKDKTGKICLLTAKTGITRNLTPAKRKEI